MRYWVCALSLGCANAPEPTAPEPVPVAQAPVVVVPAPPVGPSRLEVLERMKSVKQASYRVLGAGWTRVGTHREERVLKPVCDGDVPHLGVALDRESGRLHAYDGRQMVVHDILGLERKKADHLYIWLVPSGAQHPVHGVRIEQLDSDTTRWRGERDGPSWADGADWVRDGLALGLMRVEQLDCRP